MQKEADQISLMIFYIKILIFNTIFIRGKMGDVQIKIIFFLVFIGVDFNRWLWNYIKITQFTKFIRGEDGVYINLVPFVEGGTYQIWIIVSKRGGGINFGHFVITQ